MRKRGRVSAAELEVVAGPFPQARPDPPSSLTKEQAEVWRQVVEALPVGWFGPEAHGLLVQYCRHVVEADRLARRIDEEWKRRPFDEETYARLRDMRARESAVIKSLAVALRLSPSSRMRPETAGRAAARSPGGPRPWERG